MFNCEIGSTAKKTVKNTLTIRASQLAQLNLASEIFGEKNETYISHYQLFELASEIQRSILIYEEQENELHNFQQHLIEAIIDQATQSLWSWKKFPDALFDISSFKIKNEILLAPSSIMEVTKKVFYISSPRRKIKVNKNFINLVNQKDASGQNEQYAILLSLGLVKSIGLVEEKEMEWDTVPFEQQLIQLNQNSEREIKWKIQGNNLIPESINLIHILRSPFEKGITIQREFRIMTKSQFLRKFSLKFERPAPKLNRIQVFYETFSRIIANGSLERLEPYKGYIRKQFSIKEQKELCQMKAAQVERTLQNLGTRVESLRQDIESFYYSIISTRNMAIQNLKGLIRFEKDNPYIVRMVMEQIMSNRNN